MSVLSKKVVRFALSLAAAGFVTAGCADAFTFSHDFKREGLKQYDNGEYVDAAGSFRAAAKQDPTDYRTQEYLGMCYEKTGAFHQAVESYRLCLALMQQMPYGRSDTATHERVMGALASLIGNNTTAESEIDAIQKSAAEKHSSEDYRLLARVFALRGDADSAMDDYRRAASFAPDDFSLAKEQGMYLAKINQTTEAARVLRHAHELNTGDASVVASLRQLGVTDAQLSGGSSAAPLPTPEAARSSAASVDAPRD